MIKIEQGSESERGKGRGLWTSRRRDRREGEERGIRERERKEDQRRGGIGKASEE